MSIASNWQPPAVISLDEVHQLNAQVMAMPEQAIDEQEDIFRIHELELAWDIGVMSYAAREASKVSIGPDGKQGGIFLLHGGRFDFKSGKRRARALPEKFGLKSASMNFPGRYSFADGRPDW